MEYVNWEYFSLTYLGSGVSQSDFPRYNKRAQELIDAITRYEVMKNGLTSYSELTQQLVKKAVCAQIEYYGQYGFDIGFGADDTGFTVGKVTVQGAGGQAEGSKNYICPRALIFLEQTGLLVRNVGVIC